MCTMWKREAAAPGTSLPLPHELLTHLPQSKLQKNAHLDRGSDGQQPLVASCLSLTCRHSDGPLQLGGPQQQGRNRLRMKQAGQTSTHDSGNYPHCWSHNRHQNLEHSPVAFPARLPATQPPPAGRRR